MPVEEVVFKGEFIAAKHPNASIINKDQETRFYQLKLDQIFSRSTLAIQYLFSEIILIER